MDVALAAVAPDPSVSSPCGGVALPGAPVDALAVMDPEAAAWYRNGRLARANPAKSSCRDYRAPHKFIARSDPRNTGNVKF